MIALAAVCALGALYVVLRSRKLPFVRALAARNRLLGFLASLLPLAACACFYFINMYTAAVALVHLVFLWLLCDLTGRILNRLTRRKPRRYTAGYAALALTALVLAVGWYNAHHVSLTRYTFSSDKLDAPLRVALVSDSHLGITQDGESFSREMERLAAQEPDLLVIAGDFVDDDSSREDMLAACDALGRLELPNGVWFICGNHDRGYFRSRNFSAQELFAALERNGVTVLTDESALADGRLYVIGREDASRRGRASMAQLTADLDPSKFWLVVDHQPTSYDEEAAAGADLVVSGHTHGGHLFPMGQIGLLLIGANDRFYGTESRGTTDFVVTSGISGWAVPIKTGCFSEMVIIDVLPDAEN